MTKQIDGWRGILVFAAVAMTGVTAVAVVLHAMSLSVNDRRAGVLVMAAMWIPAAARLIATRTVDRGFHAPFPLRGRGAPRVAVALIPLAVVGTIYLGAYGLASLAGVPREPPVWSGAAAAINIGVNLPLLAAIDLAGGLGEEIGWRGYLQPRLDQIGAPASLLWVIILETIFHVPLVLLGGYLADGGWPTSIALFFGLSLGATPLWTWATYRWRTVWIAAWFHAFHNALSQVLVPKALGAGDPFVLGESGVFPVACYLVAAGLAFGTLRARGQHWRDFATETLEQTATGTRREAHL
jgi:uncharacterized protein